MKASCVSLAYLWLILIRKYWSHLCDLIASCWSGLVAHACSANTWEAETGGLSKVSGEPGLHSPFYTAWPTVWEPVSDHDNNNSANYYSQTMQPVSLSFVTKIENSRICKLYKFYENRSFFFFLLQCRHFLILKILSKALRVFWCIWM